MENKDNGMDLKQMGNVATLEEHHQALFHLLQEFDRVCRALGIPYFLFAGTLLGAVRHGGFIPWDDDLDVIMKRQDYERFLIEAPDILNQDKFYLQREFSEHWPMFFSKLRLNGTTCLEKYHPKDPEMHQGIYMDIFPCDNAYSNRLGRVMQFVASKIVIAKGLEEEGYITDSRSKKIFMSVCRFLPIRPFHEMVKGPKQSKKYVHCFLGGAARYSKSVFPGSWFEKNIFMPFEQGCFNVPDQYDALLKTMYGDYMCIPSIEERKIKEHAILVDLNRSYEYYKSYRDGMVFEMHTRSIR